MNSPCTFVLFAPPCFNESSLHSHDTLKRAQDVVMSDEARLVPIEWAIGAIDTSIAGARTGTPLQIP
jgi:hypothetical protein